MKAVWLAIGGVFAAWVVPQNVEADIVEQQFVRKETGEVASGYVFQGSRNMRNLGRRRSVSPPGKVSILTVDTPVTVLPALDSEELRPKPRFGYGSDYRPGEVETHTVRKDEKEELIIPPQAVYQFRYQYPVTREYWPSFRYYGSPYGCNSGVRYSGYPRSYRSSYVSHHGIYSSCRSSSLFLHFGW